MNLLNYLKQNREDMKLTNDKTKEFIANNGWSAKKFFNNFEQFKDKLFRRTGFTIHIQRSFAAILNDEKEVCRLYPHYKGRKNDTISVVVDKEIVFDYKSDMCIEDLVSHIVLKHCRRLK